jgi:hypothetical protein
MPEERSIFDAAHYRLVRVRYFPDKARIGHLSFTQSA